MINGLYRKSFLSAGAAILILLSGSAIVQAQSYEEQAAASAEVRIQHLENEIQSLTGQIEQQNYQIQQLEKQLSDMALRVRELENGGAGAMSGVESSSPPYTADQSNSGTTSAPNLGYAEQEYQEYQDLPVENQTLQSQGMVEREQKSSSSFHYQPPESGGARPSEQLGTLNRSSAGSVSSTDLATAAYENAFALLKASDFDSAETEFKRFLDQYPDNSLVPNAKYWYGETFYVRGQYDKAARIFAEGYQSYPKGGKAADNLLKLGMSLAGLNKTEDACVALKQLEKEYSKTSGPVIKRAKQEISRLGC